MIRTTGLVSLFIHSYDLFMQRDIDVPGVSISFKFVSSQNKRWTIWSVLSIPHEQKNNIYHHNLLASTVRSDSWKTWIGWFLIEKRMVVLQQSKQIWWMNTRGRFVRHFFAFPTTKSSWFLSYQYSKKCFDQLHNFTNRRLYQINQGQRL